MENDKASSKNSIDLSEREQDLAQLKDDPSLLNSLFPDVSLSDIYRFLLADSARIEKIFPEFRIEKMKDQIGSGSFGEVRKVKLYGQDGAFVVKLFHDSSPEDTKSLIKELIAMRFTQQENLLRCEGFTRFNNKFGIVMKKMDNNLLSFFFMNEPGVVTKLEILLKIAKGIAHLHLNKVVHLDLKPQNILLSNGYQEVVVTDFGIAHFIISTEFANALNSTIRGSSSVKGTIDYVAPELYEALERKQKGDVPHESVQVTRRADVYSFGAIMLNAFKKETEKQWHSNRTQPFVVNRTKIGDTPIELIDLIEECMSIDPIKRPRMCDVVKNLEQILANVNAQIFLDNVAQVEEDLNSLSLTTPQLELDPKCRTFLQRMFIVKMESVKKSVLNPKHKIDKFKLLSSNFVRVSQDEVTLQYDATQYADMLLNIEDGNKESLLIWWTKKLAASNTCKSSQEHNDQKCQIFHFLSELVQQCDTTWQKETTRHFWTTLLEFLILSNKIELNDLNFFNQDHAKKRFKVLGSLINAAYLIKYKKYSEVEAEIRPLMSSLETEDDELRYFAEYLLYVTDINSKTKKLDLPSIAIVMKEILTNSNNHEFVLLVKRLYGEILKRAKDFQGAAKYLQECYIEWKSIDSGMQDYDRLAETIFWLAECGSSTADTFKLFKECLVLQLRHNANYLYIRQTVLRLFSKVQAVGAIHLENSMTTGDVLSFYKKKRHFNLLQVTHSRPPIYAVHEHGSDLLIKISNENLMLLVRYASPTSFAIIVTTARL